MLAQHLDRYRRAGLSGSDEPRLGRGRPRAQVQERGGTSTKAGDAGRLSLWAKGGGHPCPLSGGFASPSPGSPPAWEEG